MLDLIKSTTWQSVTDKDLVGDLGYFKRPFRRLYNAYKSKDNKMFLVVFARELSNPKHRVSLYQNKPNSTNMLLDEVKWERTQIYMHFRDYSDLLIEED